MKYALVFTLVFIVHCLVPTTSFAIIHPIETTSHSSIVLKKKMSFKEKISLKFYQLRNVLIQEDTKTYTDEEKRKFGNQSLAYGLMCWVLLIVASLFLIYSFYGLGLYFSSAIPFACFFLSKAAIRKGKRAGENNIKGQIAEILGISAMIVSIVGIVLSLLFLTSQAL